MIYALYHAATETLGIIEPLLKEAKLPFKACNLHAGDTLPTDANSIDGLIVMGGPMNVDETHLYSYLAPEIKLIENVIAAGKPVLGICLGSQLIAKALGEKVYANEHREVGWHPVHLTSAGHEDALFAGSPSHFNVLHWHGDTYNLPSGATHLAFSGKCENQAFRYGNNVYGLQFHLEVDPAMVKSWIQANGSAEYIRGADENPEKILATTDSEFHRLEPLAKKIFKNFFDVAFLSIPNR